MGDGVGDTPYTVTTTRAPCGAKNHAKVYKNKQLSPSIRVGSREISEQKMQIIVGWADLPRLILGLLGFAP